MVLKKVLIPAAGLGTRFYPFSKAVPKELLPILNVPVIDYVLEEAFKAGLTDVISVVSSSKKTFEDCVEVITAAKGGSSTFVRQNEQKGLGHAVWCARGCCSNDMISIMLPDNIFVEGPEPMLPMVELAVKHGVSLIAVQEVATEQTEKYGIVDIADQIQPGVFNLKKVVEKPKTGVAPSNLAIVGRYILHSDIFSFLEKTERGAVGEYQLTDAIQLMIKAGRPVCAYKIQSKFLDVGTPVGWLKAILTVAKSNKDLRELCRTTLNL